MTMKQAPHEKMTEEEIRSVLKEITCSFEKFQEQYSEFLDNYRSNLYRLEKHFFPEKFFLVSLESTTKMLEEYFSLSIPENTGRTLRMENPNNYE